MINDMTIICFVPLLSDEAATQGSVVRELLPQLLQELTSNYIE